MVFYIKIIPLFSSNIPLLHSHIYYFQAYNKLSPLNSQAYILVQQSLLEVIEEGSVTLIASTADNPYFVVYKAILSRSTIFEFKPIQKEDIYIGLKRAINRLKPLYTYESITAEDSALRYISETCNGDMRSALNKLELAFNLGIDIGSNSVNITLDDVVNSSSMKILNYDNKGDDSYSILSARPTS